MTIPSPEFFDGWKDWVRRLRQEFGASPMLLPEYSVNNLPKANRDGMLIFVPDETGGPTVAFSDQGSWRRVQDRSVVA